MLKSLALTAAVAMAAAAPASAAMWYAGQNTKTMACIVSQTKPTGSDMKTVEHKTFSEAAGALMGLNAQGGCKTVTLAAVPSADMAQMHAKMTAEIKAELAKSAAKAEAQPSKLRTTATAPAKPGTARTLAPSKPSPTATAPSKPSASAPSGGTPSSGGY
jgi:hypothetical protein